MKVLGFVSLALALIGHVSAISTYYMDLNCGQTIYMNIFSMNALRLKLTSGSYYSTNCYVTIQAPSSERMMLYFKSMSLGGNRFSCGNNYLEAFDGSSSSSSYVSGLSGRQCGNTAYSTVYTTTGSNLYLRLTSDVTWQDRNFEMIITAFHTGLCYSYEYSCDNGRCVDNTVTCNGYNPCGDHSDCPLAGGAIAGIVIGGIVFSAFVVVFVIIVLRRRRYRYIQRNAPGPYITTTTTSYGTGYNQPVTVAPPPAYPGTPYPTGQYAPPSQPYPQ